MSSGSLDRRAPVFPRLVRRLARRRGIQRGGEVIRLSRRWFRRCSCAPSHILVCRLRPTAHVRYLRQRRCPTAAQPAQTRPGRQQLGAPRAALRTPRGGCRPNLWSPHLSRLRRCHVLFPGRQASFRIRQAATRRPAGPRAAVWETTFPVPARRACSMKIEHVGVTSWRSERLVKPARRRTPPGCGPPC